MNPKTTQKPLKYAKKHQKNTQNSVFGFFGGWGDSFGVILGRFGGILVSVCVFGEFGAFGFGFGGVFYSVVGVRVLFE